MEIIKMNELVIEIEIYQGKERYQIYRVITHNHKHNNQYNNKIEILLINKGHIPVLNNMQLVQQSI